MENPKCACLRPATYGPPIPGYPATHCAMHRSTEMISKIYGLCNEKHCMSKAKYGTRFLGKIKCPSHKTPDMLNLEKYDSCEKQSCTQKAIYGYISPLRCAAHRDNDMKDFVHQWCNHPGCTLATSNNRWFCPAHC